MLIDEEEEARTLEQAWLFTTER